MRTIVSVYRSCFYPVSAYFRSLSGLPQLRRGQHGISGHIIGHVSQSDLGSDTNYANSTHHRAAGTHRHNAKDVFDPASNFRSAPVATLLPGCQLFVSAALALNMLTKTLFFQFSQRLLKMIGRTGIDIPSGVVRIKQLGKYLTVMHAGFSHFVAENQFVSRIYADVVLIAKERCAVLLRPAGIGVSLPSLCLEPG